MVAAGLSFCYSSVAADSAETKAVVAVAAVAAEAMIAAANPLST